MLIGKCVLPVGTGVAGSRDFWLGRRVLPPALCKENVPSVYPQREPHEHSALFIRRPVATVLIMLGMLFFGLAGYRNLPVNPPPTVDFPTIQVIGELAGPTRKTMASSIATPLEKEFTIAGIDSISSVSSTGRTRITIQFALDRNIDAAALDVQSAIGLAQRRLPSNMIQCRPAFV